VFDRWNGEDLVTAMRVLCVSDRLKRTMVDARLAGVAFEPAIASQSDGFTLGQKAYAKKLPAFFHLRVLGLADGPETWIKSKVCPKCGVRSWKPTMLGVQALVREGDDMPVREVYADSWKDEDIFDMPDGYRHVVTERFRQVMDSVNPKDARYGPAKWVER
jgi:hypothetical protein